jgi:hypothetical protein
VRAARGAFGIHLSRLSTPSDILGHSLCRWLICQGRTNFVQQPVRVASRRAEGLLLIRGFSVQDEVVENRLRMLSSRCRPTADCGADHDGSTSVHRGGAVRCKRGRGSIPTRRPGRHATTKRTLLRASARKATTEGGADGKGQPTFRTGVDSSLVLERSRILQAGRRGEAASSAVEVGRGFFSAGLGISSSRAATRATASGDEQTRRRKAKSFAPRNSSQVGQTHCGAGRIISRRRRYRSRHASHPCKWA